MVVCECLSSLEKKRKKGKGILKRVLVFAYEGARAKERIFWYG
jgi:hypothetical protein